MKKDQSNIQSIILERVELAMKRIFTADEMKQFELLSEIDKEAKTVALEIRRKFHANIREELVNVQFEKPVSWLDMLKQRYFPAWLLRWFPYREELVERSVTFSRAFEFPNFPTNVDRKFERFRYFDNHEVSGRAYLIDDISHYTTPVRAIISREEELRELEIELAAVDERYRWLQDKIQRAKEELRELPDKGADGKFE
jgi:hypothetical protein